MANPEHLQILEQGVEAWNQWRERNKDITPDLAQATLARVALTRADLRPTHLFRANLRRGDLGANLGGANLALQEHTVTVRR